MKKNKRPMKIVIVMPAYNASKTLKATYDEIPQALRKHVLLVDDRSTDRTISVAKKLHITVIEHSKNLGYGANQKTCYQAALKMKADVVAMLHPDYQYSAEYLTNLIQPLVEGRSDFMFGSRIANRKGALDGGMPKLKYFTNRLFTVIQNIILGVNFTEHFSGFRAYSAEVLKTVPFTEFSDDFLFDLQMTLSALSYDFRISEIPIPTRYDEESSQMSLQKGVKFILETLGVLTLYILHNLGLIKTKFLAPTS